MKTCKYCGELPEIKSYDYPFDNGKYYVVMCRSDRCEIKPNTNMHGSKEGAISEWNRYYGRAGDSND